jgi:hypothetical protein
MEATRLPDAVGVKVTGTVQLVAGARVVQEPDEREKSPAFVPVRVMPVNVSEAVPVLVRMTGLLALVVPTD